VCRVGVGVSRQKKLNYYQRWRQRHKAVTIYLSPEEYETLRQLAGGVGLTFKDLLYGAAKDVKKLYEEVVHKYFGVDVDELKNEYETKITKLREEYESEIAKLRQDYEAKIAELRQDCEKLKQDYENKLVWEYFHGYADGRNSIKRIVFNQCEVKCPEDVLKALGD
jgi:flagellar biosynthesis/type III secretory pathway protein FliH